MADTREPISLFVVHWNRPLECAATVEALLAQNVAMEVTVVDNASEATALDLLRSRVGAKAGIVRLSENRGWGPALNVLLGKWLEAGKDAFCLISAHDAVPSQDCVQLLLQAMERDSQIGIACPQYADSTVPRFTQWHGVQLHVDPVRPRGTVQFVDVPHGTLLLVRRKCLEQIGLFDERYFAYGDEHELGARAHRRGWKVALVWGAVVSNPETSTPSAWRSYLFARNSLLLVHDYFGRIAASVRAILILANTFRLIGAARDKSFAFSAKARFKAVRDYFSGHFGRPAFE
jgi:N-acetylglucosaminyl-diphospho-decaprenol L-rhamnosyltransferase